MLPKDPIILLSYLNTQLRDYYPSLRELCKSNDWDEENLKNKLKQIDYFYDEAKNQFL